MNYELNSVGVFCGSSMGTRVAYRDGARELGELIVNKGWRLIYGGANVGLMKILADTVLDGGGEVTGIMPRMLVEKEVAHPGLTRMIIVESMSERKNLMVSLCDSFIAMPGGFGTLDELAEVLTYNQLRLSDKPIGIYNLEGYFDLLLKFLDHGVAEKFVREEHRTNLIVDSNLDKLIEKMQQYRPVGMDKWIREIHEESK